MSAKNGSNTLALPSLVTSMPSVPTPLTESIINTLNPIKLFNASSSSTTTPLTSISHNPQGTYFVTTSPNGSLQLYDAVKGRHFKTIYSKKYGCSNASFTLRTATQSTPTSCLIASTIPTTQNDVSNHAMRLLDLNTNSFIRYFQAHTRQVSSIVSSPSPAFGLDSFYSASFDGSIRAWESRTDKCYACLGNMGSDPVISLSQSGTLMAIWTNDTKKLRIVPIESFPMGIILDVFVPHIRGRVEKIIWAMNDMLILDTPGYNKTVIDSHNGKVLGSLCGVTEFAVNGEQILRNGSSDVTPDGTWCLSGSGDGSVLAWDMNKVETTKEVSPIVLKNDELISKQVVPRILSVNPKLGSVVTADTEIVISLYAPIQGI